MLLGLAGVTGVGKSYFKDKIVEKLGFEKIKIVTNREMRAGEKNNEDKIFVNNEELAELKKAGKIGFDFDMLGNTYAYLNKELFSDKNMVFEVHYSTILDFKKVCPNMKTIYIFPTDIEMAKQKTRDRHLKPIVEEKRLLEIDEHFKKMKTDNNLKSQFDYFVYNNYDEESEQKVFDLVRSILSY